MTGSASSTAGPWLARPPGVPVTQPVSSGLKTKLGNLETGSCRASESETPPAPASRPGLLLPVPVTEIMMLPRLARGTMIWQSSSEADSQAASESELAVQAAAAASESDSALTPGLGSHESGPTRAVTVTGPWLLTTRKSCRQLERRWQPGGPLALALAASSLGMTPHCPGLTLPDNSGLNLNY